jgi:hypothetical protein
MALLPFKDCSSILISGATSSGKTQWTYKLLQNLNTFETPPDAILFCYGVWQSLYDDIEAIPNVKLYQGLPNNLDEWCPDAKHRLIIIDDLMDKVVNDINMSLLFTQGCHHKHISTIYNPKSIFTGKICQNYFSQYTIYDFVSLTERCITNYHIRSSVISREVYEDVMKNPYSYLVIDNSPHGHAEYRLRTNIFPDEYPLIYISKV